MVDSVGLVHMNGRVYDPELGRFLSADPHVQDATNLQSWNRYAYVLNNPLSHTPTRQDSFSRSCSALSGAFLLGGFIALKSVAKESVVKSAGARRNPDHRLRTRPLGGRHLRRGSRRHDTGDRRLHRTGA